MSALPGLTDENNRLLASVCFMTLPIEIRQMIYRHLFGRDPSSSDTGLRNYTGFRDYGWNLEGFVHTGVLNANRQTRNEAFAVLFEEPMVFYTQPETGTPSKLPVFPLSMLKHVKLECCLVNRAITEAHPLHPRGYLPDGGIEPALRYLSRPEVRLRTLEIQFFLSPSCRLEDVKVFLQPSTEILSLLRELRIEQRLCLGLKMKETWLFPHQDVVLNQWRSCLATEVEWEMERDITVENLFKAYTWNWERKSAIVGDVDA